MFFKNRVNRLPLALAMPILMVVSRVLPLSPPLATMMIILTVIGTFYIWLIYEENMFLVTHMVTRTSIHTRMVIHMVPMKTCMVYICTLWECG